MVDLPPTTSASQLVQYGMCPRKYFLGYVLGLEPEFRSIPLILGSAVHGAVGHFFEERLAGHSATVEAALEITTADIVAATAETNVRWKSYDAASLEEEGRRLVRTYLAAMDELPVTKVEVPFEVPLVHPVTGEILSPRRLRGYIDLVTPDWTVELKTSSRPWASPDLDRHLQIGAYAFAAHHAGTFPAQLMVHVVVKSKREPRVDLFPVHRSEQSLVWWAEAAAAIERAILGGHFPPSPGPLCIECEHQSACLTVGLESVVAPMRRHLPIAPAQRENVIGM